MEEVAKPQNKGKRKIPIAPIENKTKKQVTFSKRRGGLIKKGGELASLCGANVAIITFSGAGKLFSFGHPNAEDVVQRYVRSSQNNGSIHTEHFTDSSNKNNNSDFGTFFKEYKDVIGQMEAEKKASTSSNSINNNYNGGFWWDANIDELGLVELEHFKVALEGLRNQVATKFTEINQLSTSLIPQNFDFSTGYGYEYGYGYGYENMVARQGLDVSTNYPVDSGVGRNDNLYQVPSRVDSFDMFTKRET